MLSNYLSIVLSIFLMIFSSSLEAGKGKGRGKGKVKSKSTQDCTASGVQTSLNQGIQPFDIYKACNNNAQILYGKTYQGGLIAYLNTTDGSGLIAAPGDSWVSALNGNTTFTFWHNMNAGAYTNTGATDGSIGAGASNTKKILQSLGNPGSQPYWPYSYSAFVSQVPINGYDDWALPSANEMTQIMNNVITAAGCNGTVSSGTGYGFYWTSTETSFNYANVVDCNGNQGSQLKNNSNPVRMVRYFAPMPTIQTASVEQSVSGVSAGGIISNPDNYNITDEGVAYGVNANPTIAGTHISATLGDMNYLISLPDLTAGVTYYVRAYVSNGGVTVYGDSQTFTYNTPVVTEAPTAIGAHSATFAGSVDSSLTSNITARGVVYNTTGNPTTADTVVNIGTGTGSFQQAYNTLHSNQTYYVRAFVTDSTGTAYGSQMTFTTLTLNPGVSTSSIYFILGGVFAGATVTNPDNLNLDDEGVAYDVNPDPTISGTHVSAGSNILNFQVGLPNLVPHSTYFVRAYVKEGANVYYGDNVSFAYEEPIQTAAPTAITTNSVTFGGKVYSQVSSPISARGIVYNTSGTPTLSDTVVQMGTGTGVFQGTATGLHENQTYYFRSFATTQGTTYYGSQMSFLTLSTPPTVATSALTIGLTNVVGGGTVTNPSDVTLVDEGLILSTNPSPTVSPTYFSAGSLNPTFSINLANLENSSTYYVTAYIKVGSNYIYGNTLSFTYNAPVTTQAASQVSYSSATLGGAVSSFVTTNVSARGVVYSTRANPTTSDTVLSMGTGTGAFQGTASSLQQNQTYYARAYATDSQGTVYGPQVTFTTSSAPSVVDLNFLGLTPGGSVASYTEQGYTLTGMWNGSPCATNNSCIYAGETSLSPAAHAAYLALSTENFQFKRADGNAFTLSSVMLSPLNRNLAAQNVTFTGHLTDGSTVTYTANVPANVYAFQTYTFPNTFTNLSYVTWNPGLSIITNVRAGVPLLD